MVVGSVAYGIFSRRHFRYISAPLVLPGSQFTTDLVGGMDSNRFPACAQNVIRDGCDCAMADMEAAGLLATDGHGGHGLQDRSDYALRTNEPGKRSGYVSRILNMSTEVVTCGHTQSHRKPRQAICDHMTISA